MLTQIREWFFEITNVPTFTVQRMGPSQILDILIVAMLFYFVIRWIKRTQAWVLLKGVAFLLFLAIAAEVFNLVTVQWLVTSAIGMGPVIIVILFQPELRKALEQIGKGSYIFKIKNDEEQKVFSSAHTLDEIIKAAKQMSSTSTGALIVVEQEVDLSEYEKTGIPIDAVVSAQLLVNIFEKNTPLHDKAVIIKNNRVSAASCILPLTSTVDVDAAYGTRHRAAIGMSEVSDARVVVVSEETGAISLAVSGDLIRGVSEAQMRDLLLWGEPTRARFSIFRPRRKR